MFFDQFAFDLPALVNFVGGGGKTSLILALFDEHLFDGPIVYTTTTRIHPPNPSRGVILIACDAPDLLKLLVERVARLRGDRVCRYVVTKPAISPTLLQGVAPDFARMLDRSLFPLILNEADGARGMSLKMPRAGEPVLMEGAQYLVPVIGLDCLLKPLGPDTLFRWEMASERYALEAGRRITPELAAFFLLHPAGVCKDWQPGMKIIPFINKADSEVDDPLAQGLAHALLQNKNFPVERVVWGSVLEHRAAFVSA